MGGDDGLEHTPDVLARFQESKTRLARESYLDENDIGVSYTHTLAVLNKIDDPEAEERLEMMREMCQWEFPEHRISALQGDGVEELREAIYRALDVVRVYTKSPTKKEPDYDKPYTIRRGGVLSQVAEMVHKDFAEKLKHARVWGEDIHPGTTVKGDYEVRDKDVVELHI